MNIHFYKAPTTNTGEKMNTNELADAMEIRASIRRKATSRKSVTEGANDRLADQLDQAATMLRQQQKERDLLFSAHSHEMVRADELQIEVDRLTMLVEAMTTECNRLYRVIELNGRVYDFDNPLLDVCKHGNDSACKECYLETVKK